MRLPWFNYMQRFFAVKNLCCFEPTLYFLRSPSSSTCIPSVGPWFHASQGSFLFSFSCIRPASSAYSSDEASPSDVAQDSKRTDDLSQQIAFALQKKPWCSSTENEFKGFLPLSTFLLHGVLHQDIEIEPALSFLSWACKQPGVVLDADEVNEIARLWASKYASITLSNLQQTFDGMGSSYTEAVWAALMTMRTFLRKPNEAVSIFMELGKHGCKVSRLSCEALVHALVKCQEIDAALLTMKEMLVWRIIPGNKLLWVVFKASCKAGKLNAVFGLVEEGARLDLVEFAERAHTRLVTIQALVKLGREAQQYEGSGTHETMLLTHLFSQGRADDAVREFETMQRHSSTLDAGAYLVMIKNLCNSGDIERALYFKKALKEKGLQPDEQTYRALEDGLCSRSRYVDELVHLAEEMKSGGYSLSAELYHTLVTHFCTLCKHDMARVWVKEMIGQGHKPTPYIWTKFPELFDGFGE